MADIYSELAGVLTDLSRIDPALGDPLRHAKRECKRQAYAALEHAVQQARMALHTVEAMNDAQRDAQRAQAQQKGPAS